MARGWESPRVEKVCWTDFWTTRGHSCEQPLPFKLFSKLEQKQVSIFILIQTEQILNITS